MKSLVIFLVLFGTCYSGMCQTFPYEREWGKYNGIIGNINVIKSRAHTMDGEGNVYSVGYVADTNILSTSTESHQPAYGGGQADGFIIKYSSEGEFLWATYFGGEEFDEIEAIAVDNNDQIVVIGITYSATGIATQGAFQEQPTDVGGGYFLAKFTAEGNILWGIHFYNAAIRPDDEEPYNFLQDFVSQQYYRAGLAINEANDIFIFTTDYGWAHPSYSIATPNAFQEEALEETTISRFSSSGQRLWTTYYGINSSDINGIAVDNTGVYVAGTKTDLPTSPHVPTTYFDTFGEYEFSYANIYDVFVSGFSLDGTTRLWSCYLGGSAVEHLGMSPLVLDSTGLYIAGFSIGSTNGNTTGIATEGAYKEENGCGYGFLAKLHRSGEIDWVTYTVDRVEEAYEGTTINCGSSASSVDIIKSVFPAKTGVYYTGQTSMYADIATEGVFMETLYGNTLYGQNDAFIMKFSPTGEREWGTFFGGELGETIPWVFPFQDSFYVVGQTSSEENIDTFGDEIGANSRGYINKFSPTALGVTETVFSPFTIYPNPVHGILYIRLDESLQSQLLRLN